MRYGVYDIHRMIVTTISKEGKKDDIKNKNKNVFTGSIDHTQRYVLTGPT